MTSSQFKKKQFYSVALKFTSKDKLEIKHYRLYKHLCTCSFTKGFEANNLISNNRVQSLKSRPNEYDNTNLIHDKCFILI